ncbi:response regulator [Leptolyngbya sp. NK1-12]|uniref:Response regulator n=1 Tax=Leptolyngbya sp. NK1-12 TaxID=2547451 RepID=A0AA96WK31_9CYAN|nr:response regulator [Leptolyngbya sp. NK1-12]
MCQLYNGLELCQTVRCDGEWHWLPIIFLTARTDRQTRRQVFSVGADDLILKPIEPIELPNRILNRLQRVQPGHSQTYSPSHSQSSSDATTSSASYQA